MPIWMVDINEAYRYIRHLEMIIEERNETIKKLRKQLTEANANGNNTL